MQVYTGSSGFASLFYLWSLALTLTVVQLMFNFASSLHESFFWLDRPASAHNLNHEPRRSWREIKTDYPPRVDYGAKPGVNSEAEIICYLKESGVSITLFGTCS